MSLLVHPLLWLRDAALAAAFAWALVKLPAGDLDPGLVPLAAGLAGLAGVALFPLPRALAHGLTEDPCGAAAGLALTAMLATLAAHSGRSLGEGWPALGVVLLAAPMALTLAAAADALRRLIRDGRAAAAWALFLLVLLCGTPLWLLPLDRTADPGPLAIDALVGVNPLTHLAVVSGTDYPRSDWFYRHSALGSLRYAYPAPATVIGGYVLLAAAWLAVRFRRGVARDTGAPEHEEAPRRRRRAALKGATPGAGLVTHPIPPVRP